MAIILNYFIKVKLFLFDSKCLFIIPIMKTVKAIY
ncbi:Uncharacterised protein [Serratia fonticola]|nr:Uncharacterised protein [Serratia fonticola]